MLQPAFRGMAIAMAMALVACGKDEGRSKHPDKELREKLVNAERDAFAKYKDAAKTLMEASGRAERAAQKTQDIAQKISAVDEAHKPHGDLDADKRDMEQQQAAATNKAHEAERTMNEAEARLGVLFECDNTPTDAPCYRGLK
jgi:hypothetical protein